MCVRMRSCIHAGPSTSLREREPPSLARALRSAAALRLNIFGRGLHSSEGLATHDFSWISRVALAQGINIGGAGHSSSAGGAGEAPPRGVLGEGGGSRPSTSSLAREHGVQLAAEAHDLPAADLAAGGMAAAAVSAERREAAAPVALAGSEVHAGSSGEPCDPHPSPFFQGQALLGLRSSRPTEPCSLPQRGRGSGEGGLFAQGGAASAAAPAAPAAPAVGIRQPQPLHAASMQLDGQEGAGEAGGGAPQGDAFPAAHAPALPTRSNAAAGGAAHRNTQQRQPGSDEGMQSLELAIRRARDWLGLHYPQ